MTQSKSKPGTVKVRPKVCFVCLAKLPVDRAVWVCLECEVVVDRIKALHGPENEGTQRFLDGDARRAGRIQDYAARVAAGLPTGWVLS